MRLRITKAGLLDTVQDGGRYGYQHLGINPGGAVDGFAASLANVLLGKEAASPVIEMHFPAPAILFEGACVACLTGADFTPTINNVPVPLNQPLLINAHALLRFQAPKSGARCYLALLNEWQLPDWLGSYSTNLKAGAGGYKGRPLMKGDELTFAPLPWKPITTDTFALLPWHYCDPALAVKGLAFIPGHEWNWLGTKSQTIFLNHTFRIEPASDRMGYRLHGEALQPISNENLVSSAVSFGTVQLLPNGQLVVLMADHQTTGGYPRIGHVITAHLPLLAQKKPGDEISFVMTTIEAAEEKAIRQQQALIRMQHACHIKMNAYLKAFHNNL